MTDVTNPHIAVLQQHIQQSVTQLEQYDPSSESEADKGIGSLIYLGNHQDAVPRELIMDPILNSGEIHTWMLMKIHVVNPSIPCSIPSRQDLINTLKCSRPVLSRHIQVLRALRWLTLCHEVRGKNGQFKGNIYAQHDRPLSLQDTLYLDPDYINFLEHPSSGLTLERLRQIKDSVLQHIDYQVENGMQLDQKTTLLEQASAGLSGSDKDPLDTHLACTPEVAGSLSCINMYSNPEAGNEAIPETTNKVTESRSTHKESHHVKNIATGDRVNIYTANCNSLPKNTTAVKNRKADKRPAQRDISHVKNTATGDRVNIYTDSGCSSSYKYHKTTTTTGNLRFPKRLQNSERQKNHALKQLALFHVSEGDYQFILDYLTDRIKAGELGTEKPVTNPVGLLGWIARNHVAGTLPPSSYGIREDKTSKPVDIKQSEEEKKLKEQKDIEAWARNLENLGVEVDRKTQTIVRKV